MGSPHTSAPAQYISVGGNLERMEQREYKWKGRPDYMPFLIQQVIEIGGTTVFLLCIYAFYYLIQDTSGKVVSWTLLHVVFGFVFLRQAYYSAKKLFEYRYLYDRITDDNVEIIEG